MRKITITVTINPRSPAARDGSGRRPMAQYGFEPPLLHPRLDSFAPAEPRGEGNVSGRCAFRLDSGVDRMRQQLDGITLCPSSTRTTSGWRKKTCGGWGGWGGGRGWWESFKIGQFDTLLPSHLKTGLG